MSRKSPRQATLREYIAEALNNATYEKGEVLDVVVAEATDLPGCFTEGASFEEARKNLIDAIEVWIMVALQSGDELPLINKCQLTLSVPQGGYRRAQADSGVKA